MTLKACCQVDPWIAEYTRHALAKAAKVIALGEPAGIKDPVLRHILDFEGQWWAEFTHLWETAAPDLAEVSETTTGGRDRRQGGMRQRREGGDA